MTLSIKCSISVGYAICCLLLLDARGGGGGDGVTVWEDEIGIRESGVRGVLGEIGVVDDEIGVIGESMNKRLRTMESEIESFGRRNSEM
ncbi:hypothetical protein QL285_076536 [Trifolium repens]|nr:hypothetical protein QL285_076536 [Trifolium repens]